MIGVRIRRAAASMVSLTTLTMFGVACGGAGGSGAETVPVRDLLLDRAAERGAAVTVTQSWTNVLPNENGCIAAVGAQGGGIPKGILRLDTYTTGQDANGGLIRETLLERYDTTSPTPEYTVTHDLRMLCDNGECTPTPLYFECLAAAPLSDEGMAAIIQLHPWNSNDPFTAFYLIRFDAKGQRVHARELLDYEHGLGSAAVTELVDGSLAVAYRQRTPSHLIIERLSPAGSVVGTSTIPQEDVADTGDGLPGIERAVVNTLVPLRDGGFVVSGSWITDRDIQCYTAADPKPPTTSVCGQQTGHALLGRYAATGEKLALRKLGRGFREAGSALYGAVELGNGTIAATGNVAGSNAVVYASPTGTITSVTRLCPCPAPNEGWRYPWAMAPIAVGNDLDFIETYEGPTSSNEINVRMMRLSAAGEITTARRLMSTSTKPAFVERYPIASGASWFLFEYDAGSVLRMVNLARP